MTDKCEFCAGARKEPGFDECVWCDNTGAKAGIDPGKPGSDMTVEAVFRRNHMQQWTLEQIARIPRKEPLTLNKIELKHD